MRTYLYAGLAALALAGCMTTVNGISMGNDSGPFANDGECDDPRFTGQGMADSLNDMSIGKDATDCAKLLQAERIRPVRARSESNPQMCKAIDFGNNSSEFARDGECDDPRFAGPGVDEILLPKDAKRDATDCRALCNAGEAWLR